MRILGACIFSKSFGGKFKKKWMDLTYREKIFKKTAHAYFERPYFF